MNWGFGLYFVKSHQFSGNDGSANSNVATVTIQVNPTNEAPVANDDTYTTNEDTPLNVSVPGVLENDTDSDNDSLNTSLIDDVSNGSLTLNADGSISYIPAPDFSGTDSFTYVTNDGSVDSNIATVSIVVNAMPDDTMHIGDLDGSSAARKKSWKVTVTITVHDVDHKVVADATVTGIWNDGDLGEATCITSRKGKCKVSLSGISNTMTSVKFTVTGVTHNTLVYLPVNEDPDGDSDGTNIIITK